MHCSEDEPVLPVIVMRRRRVPTARYSGFVLAQVQTTATHTAVYTTAVRQRHAETCLDGRFPALLLLQQLYILCVRTAALVL